jgi:hypothetical protein
MWNALYISTENFGRAAMWVISLEINFKAKSSSKLKLTHQVAGLKCPLGYFSY